MAIAVHEPEHPFADPFGSSADPARYVPRKATEEALEALRQAVCEGPARAVLVTGEPGAGKTLMLRVLVQRLDERFQAVYLPYSSLPPGALFAWALDLLNVAPSYDPIGAIAAHARRRGVDGGAFVLLVDDAEALPDETLHAIERAIRDANGSLIFVGATAESSAERLREVIGETQDIALAEPMSEGETLRYVETHLHLAPLPEDALEAFDPERVSDLHARSGGVPRHVNREASVVLRRRVGPRVSVDSTPPAPEPQRGEGTRSPGFGAPLGSARIDVPAAPPPRAIGLSDGIEGPEPAPAAEEPGAVVVPLRRDAPPPPAEPEPDTATGSESASILVENPPPPPPRDEEAELGERIAFENAVRALARAHAHETEAGRVARARRERELTARAGTRVEQPAPPPPQVRPQPPAPARRSSEGMRLALSVFGLCFAIGAAGGIVLHELSKPEFEFTPEPPSVAAGRSRAAAAAPAPRRVEPSPVAEPARAPAVRAAAPAPQVARPLRFSVQINATPWAEIEVDGELVGMTPLAGVMLSPGAHHFLARYADGRVVERVVTINRDQTTVAFR